MLLYKSRSGSILYQLYELDSIVSCTYKNIVVAEMK